MKVHVLPTIAGLRAALKDRRRAGNSIGLVPTMGALHEGHGSLIKRARRECDAVVVSIFINPTQFNEASDYTAYPRPFDGDVAFCEEHGVDYVFAPEEREMYPAPLDTHVEVSRLTDYLCGPFRPGHFRGVTTVVAKLFLVVLPDRAYFGEKDAQQLAVIQRMGRDLNFPVDVVAVPTVRELDGLAMSSRNRRLSPEDRKKAAVLYRALSAAAQAVAEGEGSSVEAIRIAAAVLSGEPAVRVEYLEIVDTADMQPVTNIEGPVRIAAAAWVGETRLIDNIAVTPPVAS